jgi:hypothetical protein
MMLKGLLLRHQLDFFGTDSVRPGGGGITAEL